MARRREMRGPEPSGRLETVLTDELLDFLMIVNRLKRHKGENDGGGLRYGSYKGQKQKVRDSIAEHSYKGMLMCIFLAEQLRINNLNVFHSVKIFGVHDLPEYLRGDCDAISVHLGQISKKDKARRETEAIEEIRSKFSFGQMIFELWQEYEEQKTREAKYARAVDKLEATSHMIERGIITRKRQIGAEHTALYCDEAIRNFPELEPMLHSLKARLKPLFVKQGYIWKPEYNYPD